MLQSLLCSGEASARLRQTRDNTNVEQFPFATEINVSLRSFFSISNYICFIASLLTHIKNNCSELI